MRYLVVVLALFLSGCGIGSSNPFHTEKDVLFDDSLVGTWQNRDLPGFGKIEVSRWEPAEDSYRVVVMDERDKEPVGTFRAYLCKVEDHKYLSLESESPSTNGAPPTNRVLYSTLVVDQIGSKVKLRMLTSDWLSNKLKGEPSAIKHEIVTNPDNTIAYYRLTATTEELRAFYQLHLNESRAWYRMEITKLGDKSGVPTIVDDLSTATGDDITARQ